MEQKYIKNSTFIKRLFIPLGIVVVPFVFIASRFGFFPNFIGSKSNIPYHSYEPMITNVAPLNDGISSQNKDSSNLYHKKFNFEKKFYSNEEISIDLKSQNPKSLVEMYLSFADSFRQSQMKIMVEAICKFQETTFQKDSPVFISETPMQNLSLYKNNNDSQNLLDLSKHPAAREVAVLSESSLQTKSEKNSSKYHVLVGLGPSVEFQNGLSVSDLEKFNILRTMADLLRQLLAIQQNEINLTLLNESFTTLGEEFLKYLNIALVPARARYRIESFSFGRLPAGDIIGHLETLSGLNANTGNDRRPFIPLTVEKFTNFCEISGLPHETAVQLRTQIGCFQKLRYFYTQVETNQGILNQANLSADFQQTLTTINGLLQTNQTQVQPLPILKSQSVGFNLKSYFRRLPILEMNPVFSYNFRNNDLSFGLGKAYFHSFSQFENVGFLTGLDAGFAINSRTKLFQGVKISGFVGLGISF